jgi:glutamate/tyrosine decarboxylase-like PLP-dependent enzyme
MSSLAGADVQALLADAAGRAGRYLAGLDERPVAPDDAALAGLARFDEPLPEVAGDPAGTLALLDEAGSAATVASAGGRYFGFVIGGSYPVAVAAGWLATAWDQDVALPVMSPVAARLHDVVTGWLADLLGLPPGTAAGFVSGASMANTTALTAARDHQLARAGWDVQADGLFGAPELTVVIGEYAHSTVVRALGLLGLGRNRVRRVPVDDQGRMRADCLPEDVTGPVVICAQAGEVNTGAFDPFPAIGEWARRHQAWMHVDGAFGLWALTDPSRSHLTAGLAEADSWATDGHKWLNVPYDCGIALVRRPGDLRRSFTAAAGYLPPRYRFRGGQSHAPVFAARPAGRGVGGPAYARPGGHDRPHHAHLPPCPDDGRLPQPGGPGGAERRRAQPGAGPCGHRRPDPHPHRRRPAGRNVLVRADRVAAPPRHADQCLRLGHNR